MGLFPLVGSFCADSILKAFLLNALAVALIATLAIEIREALDNEKSRLYRTALPFFAVKALSEFQKATLVAIASFFGALIVYHILYLIMGYGGGMMVQSCKRKSYI